MHIETRIRQQLDKNNFQVLTLAIVQLQTKNLLLADSISVIQEV